MFLTDRVPDEEELMVGGGGGCGGAWLGECCHVPVMCPLGCYPPSHHQPELHPGPNGLSPQEQRGPATAGCCH